MGIANHHISSQIYFSKWSNAAFAVFCSIGKEVIIGEITSLLNQLNTVKSTIIDFINHNVGEIFSEDETEQEELSLNELISDAELFLAIQISVHSDIISSDLVRTNIIISIYQKALIGPFLIFALLSNLKHQVNLKR